MRNSEVDVDTAVMQHINAGCPQETSAPEKQRYNFCSLSGCKTNEHVTIICKLCGNQYCIKHRSEEDHGCRKANGMINKVIGTKVHRQAKTPPRSPPKTPPPEMRTSSVPTLGLPGISYKNTYHTALSAQRNLEVSDGCTVLCFYPQDSNILPTYIRIHKNWILGRVLDTLCSIGELPNNNNKVSKEGEKLKLFHLMNFKEVDPRKKLGDVVTNGDCLYITRLTSIPDEIMAEVMQHLWSAERVPAQLSKKDIPIVRKDAPKEQQNVWSCNACTLHNPLSAVKCTLCGAPR